jgi:hypothetical protein
MTQLFDPAHTAPLGGLNLRPVYAAANFGGSGSNSGANLSFGSFAAMAMGHAGPVFVWQEGIASTLRLAAASWNESAQLFVDPLYSDPQAAGNLGSGPVAFNPGGTAYSSPGPPAIAVLGDVAYVAFSATTPAGTARIVVAHADRATHTWVQDKDISNTDGALNVLATCPASSPSIALVDGKPTVTWSESCAIAAQTQTQNFLRVKRLQ